jgi:Flp pilus assembly pilin Flp
MQRTEMTPLVRGDTDPTAPRGQGLVEYALLFTAVAVVVLVVLLSLAPAIGNTFNQLTQGL